MTVQTCCLKFPDPIRRDNSERVIIKKFVGALVGRKFSEKKASKLENRLYDLLLIAEGYLCVDKEDRDKRLAKVQQLGDKNYISALVGGCVLTTHLFDKITSEERRRDLVQVKAFYSDALQAFLEKNPCNVNNLALKVTSTQVPENMQQKMSQRAHVKVDSNDRLTTILGIFLGAVLTGALAAAFFTPKPPEDLCQDSTLTLCKNNLSIPRQDMPQLDGDVVTEFIRHWERKNVTVTQDVISPRILTPVQEQLLREKVRFTLNNIDEGEDICKALPIMISGDDYVLDGHHRWAACWILNEDIAVIRINVTIKELIAAANDFSDVSQEGLKYFKAKIPVPITRKGGGWKRRFLI